MYIIRIAQYSIIRNLTNQKSTKQMDLQYPSQNNVDILKQLTRLDKMTSKIAFTVKDIPIKDIVSKQNKSNIISLVQKDYAGKLIKFIDKQVIYYDKEIGTKLSKWNLLHYCAKYNAVQCMRTLLKRLYKCDSDQYCSLINLQTIEGFTPLMITIIYNSQSTFELLLHLGGSDLHIIQTSKLRAYDLALNYNNQNAIKLLIHYQDKCKKSMYVNEKQLHEEEVCEVEPTNWCDSVINYLVDCLLCFSKEGQGNVLEKIGAFMDGKKMGKDNILIDKVKIGSRGQIEDYDIQWKRLSQLPGQKYMLFDSFKPADICQNHVSLRHNLIILQCLSDFSWVIKRAIKPDNTYIDKANKSKISANQGEMHMFVVNLYKNNVLVKVTVDNYIPIIKERGEIMFISNKNQIWPIIMQKSMAKLHNSYLYLDSISPCEMVQQITGFYTKSIPIQTLIDISPLGLVTKLQQLTAKGYMLILQGRQQTQLNPQSKTHSFSILSYFQKKQSKKVLINCPKVIQKFSYSGKENRQMIIIKAHFNKHNQSCIWIDQAKLGVYFKNVIISFLHENYQRNELKIKVKIRDIQNLQRTKQLDQFKTRLQPTPPKKSQKKSIFFKFKIQTPQQEPITLQLLQCQTKTTLNLHQLQGWKNQGAQPIIFEQDGDQLCEELARITAVVGQYMCMYVIQRKNNVEGVNPLTHNRNIIKNKKHNHEHQNMQHTSNINSKLQNNKQITQSCLYKQESKKKVTLNLGAEHLHQLLLLSWSMNPLHIQYIQQDFGTIEWLSYYKTYSIRNWTSILKKLTHEPKHECFIYETINNKTILIIRKEKIKQVTLRIHIGDKTNSNAYKWLLGDHSILQGKIYVSDQWGSIQFMREKNQPHYYYMVANCFPVQCLQQQKGIEFIYQYQ